VSGFAVNLCATRSAPTAEDLFHLMFFHEELPKAPTHYRQQRWNKRRISKRWNWKRGREREIYDRRAQFLKDKWIELKRDYDQNKCRLSEKFLKDNRELTININFNNVNNPNSPNSNSNNENNNQNNSNSNNIKTNADENTKEPIQTTSTINVLFFLFCVYRCHAVYVR
jgi:hypothetical protein